MVERWTAAQAEAAAPDQQVLTAGRKLARPQPWADVGVNGSLLWGACQGSGKTPYQVSIDLTGPRYKCSCPSRKFPCKHSVALLMMWAEGHVSEAGVAEFAVEWAAKATPRQGAPAKELTDQQREQRAADAAKRLAEREARVSDGMAELDRFLTDLVAHGLATANDQHRERFSHMASRMVDQQAPGVAGWLRELATIPGEDTTTPERLSHELGMLRLLIRAWQRRDRLGEDMGETVRSHIGFSWRSEDVLALPGLTDDWAVIGMSDTESEQVSTRRVWLWGRTTGRPALVLFFGAGGMAAQSNLYPGTCVEATVHFHPGSPALRAVVGQRGPDRPLGQWLPAQPATTEQARANWRAALTQDPWLDRWPQIIAGRLTGTQDGGLALADATGVIRVGGSVAGALTLLHASGGRPACFAGEIGPEGFLPTMLLGPDALTASIGDRR
ncbi:MAG: SWIM zinc finger domain-containing protein [Arachnia sp.]